MSAATQTYSRRVSDNPNDAVISVEKDEQDPAWPWYVDGTGAQNPPRFKTFAEAKDAVDEFVDTNGHGYDPNPASEPEFRGHENISRDELDDMIGELA